MKTQNQYFPQSRPHPGETLEEKLEELRMGPKEFAIRTGKPEKTITAVLKGESSITPDMAVLFEKVLSIPAHYWLKAQSNYDEYRAREKNKSLIEEAIEWAKCFPVADMIKKRWIPPCINPREKADALLSFFGISTHNAWEDIYCQQRAKLSFRISLAHIAQPYSISSWLRKGELQASQLETEEYQEKHFKDSLPLIKKVMAEHPENFSKQLQGICLKAGVKVVYTPCLPKAPINGSTRWINDTPLIQLSGRYRRNDIFWFTFFHEAGHILLHGKKDVFLEKVEYSEKDMVKEKEADEFAIKWTLNEVQEAEILQCSMLTEDSIYQFAKKFGTHPAIIIGRLHHRNLIPHSLGRQYLEPVQLDEMY